MTDRNLKLELTWVGKDHRPRLEPRILLEEKERNYTAAVRVTENDQFENMLIKGDNLLALKALTTDEKVKGQVKCIFIDPPYNTGSAFEHYDDGLEHSLWLGLMRERLELLRDLLSEDGSIWISIDDNESHYLKVLCDEIFGRFNFGANVVWQKRTSPDARATLGAAQDHILVYAKNLDKFKKIINLLPLSGEQLENYKNPDDDPRGSWVSTDFTGQTGHATASQFYTITTPSGQQFPPPPGRCWALAESTFYRLVEEGRVWFGRSGDSRPRLKRYLTDAQGIAAWTWWSNAEVGHNQEAKREVTQFNSQDIFATPKPERLLQRIIHLATQPGDLVLDSFAGSGTTGAVAHKMGRRWIMVELGEHANTHIVPRMQKVIDGSDQGGISAVVNWKGGGGFRYYRLAPSLIKYDVRGNPVINPEYKAEMLAEACCKIEGFSYDPSQAVWWQHGRSSERDFLFVTTRYMGYAELQDLSEEVGPERSLLVLAKAYDREGDVFDNLTIKKIPDAVLDLCEWDHDDYSLKVENLPKAEPKPEPVGVAAGTSRGRKPKLSTEPGLFDAGSEA